VEKAIEELDTESAFGKQGAQQFREQYDYAEQTKKASGEEDRLEKALLEKEQVNFRLSLHRGSFSGRMALRSRSRCSDDFCSGILFEVRLVARLLSPSPPSPEPIRRGSLLIIRL
jgi:hypothetical protein